MAAATLAQARISIGAETVKEARETDSIDLRGAGLVLRLADGSEQILPENLQGVLISALRSLAGNGGVTIGQMPDELTSTVAADALGVSRPTLLKWAHEGEIDSYKIGTHTRFRRDDVLAKKTQLSQDRKTAFAELRALDAAFEDDFED